MRDVWGRAKDHAAEGGCNRKHGLVPWREKMVAAAKLGGLEIRKQKCQKTLMKKQKDMGRLEMDQTNEKVSFAIAVGRDRHLLLGLFDNLCFLSSLLRTLPPEQQIPITVVEIDECHLVQNT